MKILLAVLVICSLFVGCKTEKRYTEGEVNVMIQEAIEEYDKEKKAQLLKRISESYSKGKNDGPLYISIELWYQPIGYRWANNLASLNAFEPERFIAMYRDMDGRKTAVLIASYEFNVSLPSVPQSGTAN